MHIQVYMASTGVTVARRILQTGHVMAVWALDGPLQTDHMMPVRTLGAGWARQYAAVSMFGTSTSLVPVNRLPSLSCHLAGHSLSAGPLPLVPVNRLPPLSCHLAGHSQLSQLALCCAECIDSLVLWCPQKVQYINFMKNRLSGFLCLLRLFCKFVLVLCS